VIQGWDGDSFAGLEPKLETFGAELDRIAQDHLAYPVLHYYHSRRPEHAEALALAIFDEALTILRFGVPEEDRPSLVLLRSARAASRNYLDTLQETFDLPAEDPPPKPRLDRLREAGIPTVTDEAFEDALADVSDRRRRLLGVVEADAREWPGEGVPGDDR
jgi:hypothetical protein